MKDQNSKEMRRPFAQNKRPKKEDMYKVRIVPTKPKCNVTQEDGKIKVTKNEKDGGEGMGSYNSGYMGGSVDKAF
jgi:hypothetical protein